MSVPAPVAFGLAVLPICLTPGVSFTLVTQRVIARGRGAGFRVIAGTAAGLVCHATLAAVGLAALVMRSSEAFVLVKLVGACYLVWVGASMLWRARPSRATAAASMPSSTTPRLPWNARGDVAQGFLGNVLNPKAAAVYLTLAPQFLSRGEPVLPQMAALLAAHLIVAVSWLLAWSVAVDLGRRTFQRPRVRRGIDRATGTVLIAFGLRTAAAAR